MKKIGSLIAALLCASFMATTAFADVTFTTQEESSDTAIAVAGAPDHYPFEYYDEETGTYKGILPDLFAKVSAETGVNFEYIAVGSSDKRLMEAKLRFPCILSCYDISEKEMSLYDLSDAIPLYTYEKDGETAELGIVFTAAAREKNPEVMDTVRQAFESISDLEKQGVLVSYSAQRLYKDTPSWVYAVAGVPMLLLLALLVFLLVKKERKKAKNHQQDYSDHTTGLLSRTGLEKEYERIAVSRYREGYYMIYLAFDINRVNGLYGEDAAEKLLKHAADIVSSNSETYNHCGRVGGGAICILRMAASAEEVTQWLVPALSEIDKYTEEFSISYRPYFHAGILHVNTGRDYADALHSAREYYTQAEAQDYRFYVGDRTEEEKENFDSVIRKDLDHAFEHEELKVYIQPIVDATTGKIRSGECLARWEHPKMGVLSPGKFVELLIENGAVAELDFYMFERVCSLQERWQKERKFLRLSTNFTRVSVTQENFADRIRAIVSKYKFDHSYLVLEITEDSLEKNKARALENISMCRALNFQISLDDFGSGYTSISDIAYYPLDVVKMDRSLLLNAMENEQGRVMLQGVITLAKQMGQTVICEGVETTEQRNTVQNMGADMIQGFYFYRPLTVHEAEQELEKQRAEQ